MVLSVAEGVEGVVVELVLVLVVIAESAVGGVLVGM